MSSKKKGTSKLQISRKYNRHFSDAFRRQKVADLEAGLVTIKQLCAAYSVSRTSVYKWIYQYSIHHKQGTKQVVQMESEAANTLRLQARLAELERILGQKQLALDFNEQVIAFANEELGYDLKKNFEAKRSNISETSTQDPTR